jgi:hypothetical protein
MSATRLGEHPVRMPKADLGAVFAPAPLAPKQPADRAAGLRGLKLNPPAPTRRAGSVPYSPRRRPRIRRAVRR